MPPVFTEGSKASEVKSTCSGICTPQIVLGCVITFVILISSVPVIIFRRKIARKFTSQRIKTHLTTPRATATPRLPLNSIYIARVDYYLPISDTVLSQPAVEDKCEDNSSLLAVKSNSAASLVPSASNKGAPILSLPSLSSMLGEFTAYADAIELEVLTEARQSSNCLLDSVFSSMDVNALSYTELPKCASVLKVVDPTSPEDNITHSSSACVPSSPEQQPMQPMQPAPVLPAPEDLVTKLVSFRSKGISKSEKSRTEESQDIVVGSFQGAGIELSLAGRNEDVEEISTSQLVPATTSWSIIIDSSSTLASMLGAKLAEFPPVPPLPPLSFTSGYVVTFQSESSLSSLITSSISSTKILDIRIEDFLPRRRLSLPYLIGWFGRPDPGELWDEEDDVLFSSRLPQKPIDFSKPIRHTWTAGFSYSNSNKGELWDDDDDRRFSYDGKPMTFETFASSSILNLRSDDAYVGDLPSLDTSSSISLVRVAQSQKTITVSSIRDLRKATSTLYVARKTRSIQILFVRVGKALMGSEVWSSSTSSSLHLLSFEDLSVSISTTTMARGPICLSKSACSSLMSLVSVLDSTIHFVDPAHALKFDFEYENLEKTTFEEEDAFEDDMDLEPGFSYSSRIISVNYPFVFEAWDSLIPLGEIPRLGDNATAKYTVG
ncbi:uncharacterized protein FOMMEDRAFT_28368 [Fomitiporia mediterranea MF3/22]|uniref:uncharacterized protein n=1 Tax=Fomitiporia mediterranea (strain MF3/22) TaxID=694068 RepID=UPI0004409325|nr:uncharacterized protein FOMMEDRAFT_28368 [Fomitiporia mediterranea MF3/22]EJD02656.1 hypothetical protein FOMMEDRAFT_28368 [Fomitiporia mediterranea MF3/22]